MTQYQVHHTADELPVCACSRQPKHYLDTRRSSAGGGHFLECSPCDRRTPKRPSFPLASADWVRMVDQPAHANATGGAAVSITRARERVTTRR